MVWESMFSLKNMRWWSREYEEASRNACNKKGPSWLVRYSHPCGTDVAHTFLNEPHHPWQQSTRALLSTHTCALVQIFLCSSSLSLINGQISSRLLVQFLKKNVKKLIFLEKNWFYLRHDCKFRYFRRAMLTIVVYKCK